MMPLIAAVLMILVLSAFFRCALMDPGIIPRATRAEHEETERQINARMCFINF